MPRYICKFQDGDKAYYMEWSTIVDAPVTFGMSLEEFKDYYKSKYGSQGFDERMQRVERKGTSATHYESVESCVSSNRAGKRETNLTIEQIIEWYCRRQDDKNIPYGTRWNEETKQYEQVSGNPEE